LGVAKENLSATESSVRDIDVADEMTRFTKYQILNQSGMSMLAQANQAPQQVLSLLRGG
jgi:flagellin